MRSIVLFGGTFDPIHYGHLYTAINVQTHFKFQRFIFLPCKVPVLKKQAQAQVVHRLAMLALALRDYPNYAFEVDDREVMRDSPSYIVTTLADYRSEYGQEVAMSLLMGVDAFLQLPQWFQWEKILSLANIIVINRPQSDRKAAPPVILNLLAEKQIALPMVHQQTHGGIHLFDAGLYDLSSTAIRAQLNNHENLTNAALPYSVANYIHQHHLYETVGK